MEILVPWFVAVLIGIPLSLILTLRLPSDQRRYILRVMWAALALRIVVATLFVVFPGARVFHEDADGEEGFALTMASVWRGDLQFVPGFIAQQRNAGLIYVFAGFMFICGVYRMNATVLNSLIGMASVLIVFRIGRHLFQDLVARRGALFAAFFPSMILWSAIATKDALVGCMILVALLACIRLRERFSWTNVFGILAPVAVIYPVRFYMVYFVLVSVVGTMALDRPTRMLSQFSKQLLLGGLLVAVVVVFGLSGYASEDSKYMNLGAISRYRAGMAVSANSGFAHDADVSTPSGALLFLPIGLVHLLWSPFPWQMVSMRPIMTLPEMLVWWSLAPAIIRGVVFAFRNRFAQFSPIIVFTTALLVGYSLTMGNVGAAFRMRAQVLTLLFLFASFGHYLTRARRLGIDAALLLRNP